MDILLRVSIGLVCMIILALAVCAAGYLAIIVGVFINEYRWKSLLVPVVLYIAYLVGGVVWK